MTGSEILKITDSDNYISAPKSDRDIFSRVEEIIDNYNDKQSNNEHKYLPKTIGTDYSYKHEIVWKNAIGFLVLHFFALWGIIVLITGGVSLQTALWAFFIGYVSTEGVTIGAHRLYTHKSFKAIPFLRAMLILAQTVAGQNSMFIWVRDHRLHHRYSDTDADPHNSKRGFFFCHIGWLMTKKHPYVIELGRKIDMSDLEADWMVMYQKKYYYVLYLLLAIFIPTWVPVHYLGESWWNSLLVCYFARYMIQVNGTWLVNSAAHLWGTRPYDQNLQPVESWFVSCISLGEGWHNYHHAFPWDYKAAELSSKFNQSARIIKFFEEVGLAYDLKTASPELASISVWSTNANSYKLLHTVFKYFDIYQNKELKFVDKRIVRTGDGTHSRLGNEEARAAVTAPGIIHPLNPFFNVTYDPPSGALRHEGLPLFHEKDVFDVNATNLRNRSAKA